MQAGIAFFDRKLFLPIFPVTVFEQHGNRRTDGFPMAYPGEYSSGVTLDFHPAATAIALLPAPQLVIYELLRNLQAGRKTGKKCHQRLAVRLP